MNLESVVASTASDLKTFETKQKISYALAAKQQEVVKEQGEVILELINSTVPKGKAIGAGSKLDTTG